MLMDGGYLNNVPADVMRDIGVDVIVAVDVGAEDDTSPVNYGDALSGWWVLFNRFNPFAKDYGKIPQLSDIQSRLAYTSSVKTREDIQKLENCYYLCPPVKHFGTMDFAKYDEIEQIGYEFGKGIIQEWNESGVLHEQFGVRLERSTFGRRASI